MGDSTIIAIAVCCGVGGIILGYLGYVKYLAYVKRQHLHESRRQWRMRHRNTLTGNFVVTYHVPVEDDYVISDENILGKGSYGVVVVGAHRESKVEYAIKFVSAEEGKRIRIEREYKLLKDIDHPNIVRLFAVYDTDISVGFVMELCTGGHLGSWVDRSRIESMRGLSELSCKNVMRQLVSAVAHMHARGICHRDIKLQNILREDSRYSAQIKLIDFGLGTRFIGATPLKTRCGTLYTTAPEVLRESYDERCDIWSCGVVAFTILSGRKPFEALVLYPASGEDQDGKASVMANILMGRCHYRSRDWRKVSANAMDFTKKMMTQDYKARWSAQEALEHPWFAENSEESNEAEESADKAYVGDSENRPRKFSSTSVMSDSSGAEANMVQQAMKNLKRQADSSVIHQTSMLAVAYNMPLSKTADRRAFFQSFDVDKNGTLSKEEFRNAMLACNIFNTEDTEKLTPDDIDCIFHSVDVNGDNQISFTEFLAATLDPRDFDIQSLNSAFQLMDTDKKGYITHADMERVLSVTSAARRRSFQLSSKQLSNLSVANTPQNSEKNPYVSRQLSDPGNSGHLGRVAPRPGRDGSSSDSERSNSREAANSSQQRGRSMSLGNVLRRPSMLIDIMPILSAPRRSSMTNAAIYPIADNSYISGEDEHTTDKSTKRKKSGGRIPILSMKSAPLLAHNGRLAISTEEDPTAMDPAMTAQIQEAIKKLDRDGKGVVSYVDFLLALTENKPPESTKSCDPALSSKSVNEKCLSTPSQTPRSRGNSADDSPQQSNTLPRPYAFKKLEQCKEGESGSGGVSQSCDSKTK